MSDDDHVIKAIVNPSWVSQPTPARDGSLLQLDHPDHGTLYFVFAPQNAERLGTLLIKQAGIANELHGPPTAGTA